MINKIKFNIKNKFVNHLFFNGKKVIAEKILLKSTKYLQKSSTKNSINLFKLSILNLLPILRINQISQKKKRGQKSKRISSFILNESNRISRAIKYSLIMCSKKKSYKNFEMSLKNEILLNSQSKSSVIEFKDEFEKVVSGKENILKYYQS